MIDPEIGQSVTLIGKTAKGISRVLAHGQYWKVAGIGNINGMGRSMLLNSIMDSDARWVSLQGDDNFDWFVDKPANIG